MNLENFAQKKKVKGNMITDCANSSGGNTFSEKEEAHLSLTTPEDLFFESLPVDDDDKKETLNIDWNSVAKDFDFDDDRVNLSFVEDGESFDKGSKKQPSTSFMPDFSIGELEGDEGDTGPAIVEGSFLCDLRRHEEDLSFETATHDVFSPDHSFAINKSMCRSFSDDTLFAEALTKEPSKRLLDIYVIDFTHSDYESDKLCELCKRSTSTQKQARSEKNPEEQ